MQKYKLINLQTGEEALCDKIIIDGFGYYVNNDICDYFYDKTINRIIKSNGDVEGYEDYSEYFKGVIATNNPNIDVPKVVDEVEQLAYQLYPKDEFWIGDLATGRMFDQNAKERIHFIKGYKQSQETHPFSDEDMVEFALYVATAPNTPYKTVKELLQTWKKQKPKNVVYYE